MDPLLIWGLGLIALALVLIGVEVFVPSAGVLGFAAAGAAIAGVVCLFRYNEGWGLTGVLALLVLVPTVLYFALRLWPSTPIGRKIIGAPTEEELERQRHQAETERQTRQALVGREGLVIIELRPIGVVEIDGKRYDAVTDTSFAKAGTRVRVITAEPTQLRVRPVA